jgi:hypothetical protein
MWRVLIGGLVVVLIVAAAFAGIRAGGDGEEPVDLPFSTTAGWKTDFSNATVPLEEFRSGGPPKDGIPSIDDPNFASTDEASDFVSDREPVAVVERGGEVRAYPLQILTWHEIVNDEIGGEAVAVTYCPLCNSTVVFDRELDGEPVEFGTTGMLRKSDLVMYDRRTETWWQQLTAEAVVGELAGEELEVLPSQILSFGELKRLHPDASVLSRDTGHNRRYGQNPYQFYDEPDRQPFALGEEADTTLPPMERVSVIQLDRDTAVVYPFSRLAEEAPVNDEIDGREIVVLYDPEIASALDSTEIAAGREVGGSAVFERTVDGRTLEFEPGPAAQIFRDAQTGSTWTMGGLATDGSLEGTQLDQIPHDDQFWFALAAFFEDPDLRD